MKATWATAVLVAAATLAIAQDAPRGEVGTHRVQPGETLESITQKYLGSPRAWRENWRLNPELADPNTLQPGQTIRILLSYDEHAAAVKTISRRVDQKIADESWTSAQVGQKLHERDGIRTGPRSSAALEIDDGTDLVLGETSIVFLRELDGRLGGVPRQALEVIEGQADVGRTKPRTSSGPPPDLEVIIGGTRARSRGGEGQLRNRRTKDGAQVMSYGGATDVESAGGRVTLPEGTGTAVRRDAAPLPPERLLPAPEVVEPRDATALDHSNPTFRWRAVPGAAGYVVEVCRDAACGNVVERSGRLKPTTSWTVLRLPLGAYFWRVTALAPSGLDGYPTKALGFEVKALWRKPPTTGR